MRDAAFARWAAESVCRYAADKVRSGEWSAHESLALAKKAFDELLPRGLATDGHHLYEIVDSESREVGALWIAVRERAGQRIAYVYDIVIDPAYRRRGHAMRALRAAEDKAGEFGVAGIGLHVFGHNRSAQLLYEKLGYSPTNIQMFKPLQ
jgi:ribosomal protein S18 acetylase RimI-like enzyme